MDDLIAFVRQQLAEDEGFARQALHEDAVRPGEWVTEHHGRGTEPATCHIAEDRSGHYWSVAHEVFIPNAEHIARWDPARVLAEVKAKRAILELHEMTAEPLTGQPACRRCIEAPGEPAGWPCLTVRLLAQPYAGRPGWRDEWSA